MSQSRILGRSGFSLIELTASIAVSSGLVILMASLLQTLMLADRGARESLAEDRSLARLSAQFRLDVKQAGEASIDQPPGKPARLVLSTSSDQRVVYTFDGHLQRESQEDRKTVGHEAYLAIPLAEVRFDIDTPGKPERVAARMVRMHLDRRPLRTEGPPQPLELMAPLGRYLRFSPSAAKGTP